MNLRESRRRRHVMLVLGLLTPGILWLSLLWVVPQIQMVISSFYNDVTKVYTLRNYLDFFGWSLYWRTFLDTFFLAAWATVVSLFVAYPAAYFFAKVLHSRWKDTLLILILSPFLISSVIQVFAWMLLLSENGIFSMILQKAHLVSGPVEFLYTKGAVLLGLVYAQMLFMFLPLYSVLEGMDDSLLEAARDLGAGGFRTLVYVVLPYSKPGIVSGVIITFLHNMGSYLVPSLLGGKSQVMFVQLIYNAFYRSYNWNRGAAFAWMMLSFCFLLIWVFLVLTRQKLKDVEIA